MQHIFPPKMKKKVEHSERRMEDTGRMCFVEYVTLFSKTFL